MPEFSPREPVGYGPGGAYAKFLAWTDEKVRLTEALSLEMSPDYRTMLDVGAGDGSITRPLGEQMASVLALEPSGDFVDPPANTTVVNEKVESFLARDETLFDFVLASHVFIHVTNVPAVLAALWERVKSGGRMAIVMLNSHSAYRDFVWEFAPEVNPQLSVSGYKSDHLERDMDDLRLPWRRNVITTSLVAPSIEDFLSISSMHFNCEANNLNDDLVVRMREHLQQHLTDTGEVLLDVQHGIYVIER